MDFQSREDIIRQLQGTFQSYIEKYGIDDIGIFEEEGQGNHYYIGYTVKKAGRTYHIHTPYQKNNQGGLAPLNTEWILETDQPEDTDKRGFKDLESVFERI